MKKTILFLTITAALFAIAVFSLGCNKTQQPTIAEQPTAKPIDTTGAKPYPVWIKYYNKIDSMKGFAILKPTINEKTMNPELILIEYKDENMGALSDPIKSNVLGARKR